MTLFQQICLMIGGIVIMAVIVGIIVFVALCLLMRKLDKFGEELDLEIEELDQYGRCP